MSVEVFCGANYLKLCIAFESERGGARGLLVRVSANFLRAQVKSKVEATAFFFTRCE